jgi:hypothetical protein
MDIPEDVARFVADAIDSVAELEALLLMRREPQAPWTALALAERLYVDQSIGAAVLERLARRRFVRRVGAGYEFDPPPGDREALERLAEVYSVMLIPITRLRAVSYGLILAAIWSKNRRGRGRT